MLAAKNGLFDDLLAVLKLNLGVEPSLGIDTEQRAHFAEAVASALLETYGIVVGVNLKLNRNVHVKCLEKLLQASVNLQRSACNATGAGTNNHLFGFGGVALCERLAKLLKVSAMFEFHISLPPSVRG